jgi:2-oxoglutarate/2-oxoacid ferredoxin oxidoreductase subunit beta
MSTATKPDPEKLKAKDYASDQEVKWCPGCGDYGILKSVQKAFADIGIPKHEVAIISGIGCSSRFPYYMDTYGFHSIHGRAPAVASGVKLANPKLSVWVATGDGDGLSIGGNHLIHMIRRNVGLKVLLFNNRIYGLTKGQYSPTSEQGKVTRSTPDGSIDTPFKPMALALGSQATFVARGFDIMSPHLQTIIKEAQDHEGTAFIEIYQNCNIFNDGAYDGIVDKKIRDDMLVHVEHGKPLIFGKELDKGLIWIDLHLKAVKIGEHYDGLGREVTLEDIVVWDAKDPNPTMAFALTQLREGIDPTPIGVLRSIEGPKAYDTMVHDQLKQVQAKKPSRSIDELLHSGKTWIV